MGKRENRICKATCFCMAAALLCGCGGAKMEAASTAAAAEAMAETTAGNAAGNAADAMEGAGAADRAAPMEEIVPETWVAAMPGNDGGEHSSLSGKYRMAYKTEDFNAEEYRYVSENGFRKVTDEPLSTFSIDVDTAAYSNVRRMIRNGEPVPADAVRIEEMINYFHYDYPEPEDGEPFSVTTEYSDCPWNPENRLLMVGLQAKSIDLSKRPSSNFVFLLDVSGSMYSEDKLPLVQKAFAMLAENLTEKDRVSIVTYAGYEAVVLDGVRGSETPAIIDALESLEAGGSTAGAAGIQKAYELAEEYFIPGGNNRVILATDGDLNMGITSEGELTRLIQEKKKSGVHLSVLGVGAGNLKDNKLEALADNGDGNYNYIDSVFEAKKVLVDEMGGTLITVAKDVKIQVEFNPEQVAGYRLVGYENRLLNREDFNDDRVDAGEIGSGHTVTALYEIVPAGTGDGGQEPELKYQTTGEATGSSEILTVSLRYKAPNGDKSRLLSHPAEADSYQREMSENLAFASAVAEFGMVLRGSDNRGNATFDSVTELAGPCVGGAFGSYREEFLKLVQMAKEQRR